MMYHLTRAWIGEGNIHTYVCIVGHYLVAT